MDIEVKDVALMGVGLCDYAGVGSYSTAQVLQSMYAEGARRYLDSAVSVRMLAEIGVDHRRLTHLVGQPRAAGEGNAFELAVSAVEDLLTRLPQARPLIEAVIYVSVSSVFPTTTTAALLAERLQLSASCLDLKSGCSGGVLGLVLGAQLVQQGCKRVLVVMAENLSKFSPPDDLRMGVSVGDGAACVLLGRKEGAGFRAVHHGTDPKFIRSITIPTTYPPAAGEPIGPDCYQFSEVNQTARFLRLKWIESFERPCRNAGLKPEDFRYYLSHQTTVGNYQGITQALGIAEPQQVQVLRDHGNMGSPTFAVALAQVFDRLNKGDLLALQAVGGGVSWCTVLVEHG